MATKKFELEEFQAGCLVAWNVTTQCYNTAHIKISDGTRQLCSLDKNTRDWNLKLLGNGNTVMTSNVLNLTIDVDQASTIKSSIVAGAIMDKSAKRVGYVYDICIEDYIDDDYNDVYVNIVGWKNQA